jgi:hypothetical protein
MMKLTFESCILQDKGNQEKLRKVDERKQVITLQNGKAAEKQNMI